MTLNRRTLMTGLALGATTSAAIAGSGLQVARAAERSAIRTPTFSTPFVPGEQAGTVHYKTIEIEGHAIFYREAGVEGAPKLVLFHGFPGSSAYYRDLIATLASDFHVIAPDYLGFGNSDKPDPATYAYSFDDTARMMAILQERLGFTKAGMFLQDYGGPVGFRILAEHPGWLEWLIIQNTNAYEIGFAPVWDGLRGAYWETRSPETEKPLEAFLTPETVKTLYQHGHPNPALVSPDAWQNDLFHLSHPHAKQIQLDFFYDYRTNVALYET